MTNLLGASHCRKSESTIYKKSDWNDKVHTISTHIPSDERNIPQDLRAHLLLPIIDASEILLSSLQVKWEEIYQELYSSGAVIDRS